MVGLESLLWAYQNSGPAMLVALAAGLRHVYLHDVQPRLHDLEKTQEKRADRWETQQLNAQERTLLLDDAHERADDLEAAVQRLKKRVRTIEQSLAAERGEDFTRGGSSAPPDTPDRTVADDPSAGGTD